MKLLKLLPALSLFIGTLSLGAYAGYPPNGWTQVGKGCYVKPYGKSDSKTWYYKLNKNSDNSVYGIYRNKKTWQSAKDLTLAEANAKMNRMASSNTSCSGY